MEKSSTRRSHCYHDLIQADGGSQRWFEPLWWRAGRFIELLVETDDEPLTIDAFHLLETRYPLEMQSRFSSSDERLDLVIPVALRGLQMCAHETFMDWTAPTMSSSCM